VHGVGDSTAAITIVNALPTGIGSAVGIDLPVRAEVELHPAGSSGKWSVEVDEAARTPLVVAALTEALRRFAPGSSGTAELTVRSQVPAARGLKSSSAVSSAVVLAVARATDTDVSLVEVARLAAGVSISAGVSATGAFDDALAGLTWGIVVTDNRRRELLTKIPVGTDLGVALFVPSATHASSREWAPAFAAEATAGRVAVEAALRGDWVVAMRENTQLVERVMRYEYGPLRSELERRGALASGVSGMGPALAAVAPRERLSELLNSDPDFRAERRAVAFSTTATGARREVP
jgi:shikimate kinase